MTKGIIVRITTQLAHAGLGAVVILSIGSVVRGSATLSQFRGAGRKLALTAAGGLRGFKEWAQAVS